MEGLLLLVLIAGAFALGQLWRRTTRLEAEIARLHDRLIRLDPGPIPAAAPHEPRAVPAPPRASPPTDRSAAIGPPQPEPAAPRFTAPNLEDLIGGRLLIWVGAAALVVAAFFLVRYSIESGLIGPAARALIAAIFAALLIAASEAARRLPAFSGDQRVAQALAGAGVASAYGTLYLAAAVYALIGALPAFALMLVVTGIGLALALRHGPPTAVMALAGGFLAPLVAGFDAAGIAPLLVYLGLFIAALFALAGHRRWPWLAVAATAAGFAWTGFLIAAVDGGSVAAVGAFVILLAVAATLALPTTDRFGWLRLAPLTLGLIQLLALAPVLDFGALAWSFYLTIAAASLVLGWKDARLLLAAPIALALFLLLLGFAFASGPTSATIVAAVVGAALFGGTGMALSRRDRVWAALAALGAAGPLLVANLAAPALASPGGWFLLALIPLAALIGLTHRHRDRLGSGDSGLIGGTAFAALLAIVATGQLLPPLWIALPIVAAMALLIAWARRLSDPDLARLSLLALVVAITIALPGLADVANTMFVSLGGEALTYRYLEEPARLLAALAAPSALAIAWMLADRFAFGAFRRQAIWLAGAAAIACCYVALKLPLAIDTAPEFIARGFAERAFITQAFLAGGWLLLRRDAAWAGRALMAIGLLRIIWFDLLFLSPLAVPQAVGTLPLANLAVIHLAAAAVWFASLAATRDRRIAMALTLAAALALVRQATHGSILTGPVSTAENWGYSAILLLLAVAWLWRGIAATSSDLRRGGLGLLVLVTLKIVVIDAARLDGFLRIASFLGLGIALIGIHWLYNRFLRPLSRTFTPTDNDPPPGRAPA
ncbi:DUF2339 domain-containing protein [Sphingomonas japonica]|uniref:Membrane protein n=1 Tax=Sphingomonas japonica TaxID=511662 RepID=A0ABX0TZG6_9SPHN|nr:DUF2339 domain-containing protein [Sphingomonas japonica]NIJ23716.1 putative membrane protein [Sphingomonas japonica]